MGRLKRIWGDFSYLNDIGVSLGRWRLWVVAQLTTDFFLKNFSHLHTWISMNNIWYLLKSQRIFLRMLIRVAKSMTKNRKGVISCLFSHYPIVVHISLVASTAAKQLFELGALHASRATISQPPYLLKPETWHASITAASQASELGSLPHGGVLTGGIFTLLEVVCTGFAVVLPE